MFRNKCQDADCHINQTEPYSPWKFQAEGNIRYLKKGAGSKMVRSDTTKQIWDNALYFESHVKSNAAMDIYMLQGEVPETFLLGGTSDISQLYEHGLYNYVMFREYRIQYPNENPVLVRYLGTAIDVGPK